MGENPYQSPITAAGNAINRDPLQLPAVGCIVAAVLTIVLAVCQFVFSLRFLQLAEQAENYRAANEAREMAKGAYLMAGLSVMALATAFGIFKRRFRWLVILSSIVGIATCIPAPLAVIVLIRLWRKDVWNTFR